MSVETTELRTLLDKQACGETLTRYCRALDWLDEDALRTVFAPDAEIDYGFFKGRGDTTWKVILPFQDIQKKFSWKIRVWYESFLSVGTKFIKIVHLLIINLPSRGGDAFITVVMEIERSFMRRWHFTANAIITGGRRYS